MSKFPSSIFLLIALTACGDSEPGNQHCSASDLATALEGAQPGATIQIGSCSVAGSFLVPAGVTLAGNGMDASKIVSEAGQPGLRMTPGDQATQVKGLTIESHSKVALLARGPGSILVSNVAIQSSKGIAIGAEEVTSVQLSDVHCIGQVTKDNASTFPITVGIEDTAVYGIVLVRVTNAQLNDTKTNGFALAGALFNDTTATWTGGDASKNLGLGLFVEGGNTTLENVEVHDTYEGFRLMPSYGAVFTAAAEVTSTGLDVRTSDGYGLLHFTGTANHSGLVSSQNKNAAIWIQDVTSFDLTNAQMNENHFSGMVFVDAQNVNVMDSVVQATKTSTRVQNETGSIEVGDGVHLLRSTTTTQLSNLELKNNERTGLLVDLDGGTLSPSVFNNVSVTVPQDANGAIAQAGTIPTDWDTGITRNGITKALDDGARGLEVVGPSERPAESAASQGGLQGMTGF